MLRGNTTITFRITLKMPFSWRFGQVQFMMQPKNPANSRTLRLADCAVKSLCLIEHTLAEPSFDVAALSACPVDILKR